MEEFSDERDYFYPYAFLSDQRQMLMDAARMDAYHTAIHGNPSHFRGKAVLDCGTGTGVLAIWAAKAGARVVYAVEATDVARHTRTLVAANGVADVVKVIDTHACPYLRQLTSTSCNPGQQHPCLVLLLRGLPLSIVVPHQATPRVCRAGFSPGQYSSCSGRNIFKLVWPRHGVRVA